MKRLIAILLSFGLLVLLIPVGGCGSGSGGTNEVVPHKPANANAGSAQGVARPHGGTGKKGGAPIISD